MRVLITGGAGFIGSNLARHINQESPATKVVVLDNLSTGKRKNLESTEVEFYEGTVEDPELLLELVRDVDAVVHLGALGSVPRSVENPVASHAANLNGTLNVLEAARRHSVHVVFSSSSSVYGANSKLPKSEFDWTRPMSPYAAGKLGAEAYVLAYRNSYDLPSTVFRFFNVYGPRQAADHAYAAVIPKFIEAALQGNSLIIQGDGEQSRDFTHVDTVCTVLWDAVKKKMSINDPINLAFGTNTSILELVAILEEAFGTALPREFGPERVGDVRASRADGIRLREFFPGINPVPLKQGIFSTLAWFKSNG